MMGDAKRDRQRGLLGWAQDARVRSAACAAQAIAAADSAAAMGRHADRMIERVAERNPEHAGRLQAIAVTAASQRAVIAERKRSYAAGQSQDQADVELRDKVIQGVFGAGLTLQEAAELATEPEVRWRIEAAADDLDELIRVIRGVLFKPADRPPGRVGPGPG